MHAYLTLASPLPRPHFFSPLSPAVSVGARGEEEGSGGSGGKEEEEDGFSGLAGAQSTACFAAHGAEEKRADDCRFLDVPPPLEKEGGGTKPQCASCALGSAVGRSHARVSNVPKRE